MACTDHKDKLAEETHGEMKTNIKIIMTKSIMNKLIILTTD